MLGIFISYRREDSPAYAGRLRDRLRQEFGEDQVFMDIDTIELGTNFVEAIEDAVGSCDVLIAVIGRDWLTAKNTEGGRRLDDPRDFVRVEIESALKREVRVVPMLVRGTAMPRQEELPETLKELTLRHALDVSDERWDYDVGRLVESLKELPELSTPPEVEQPNQEEVRTKAGVAADDRGKQGLVPGGSAERRKTWKIYLAVAAAVLVVGLAAILWFSSSPDGPARPERKVAQTTKREEAASRPRDSREIDGKAPVPEARPPAEKEMPRVVLDAKGVSFKDQTVGRAGRQGVYVTNQGPGQLQISSVAISGTNARDFELKPAFKEVPADGRYCSPAPLPPSSRCLLLVYSTPSAAGKRSATLSIRSNAFNSPHTVQLSSIAVAADKPVRSPGRPHPALYNPRLADKQAPEVMLAEFETTKGKFYIEVERKWAPQAVDRFYNLVQIGFFEDVAFYAVRKGSAVFFGIHGDPKVEAAWGAVRAPSERSSQSNKRGWVSWIGSGGQMLINLTDNSRLDAKRRSAGRRGAVATPFGRVARDGLKVVESLYSVTGRGPELKSIREYGNAYLKKAFPEMDYILRAAIVKQK